MPTMIDIGNELLRIKPENPHKLEYSNNKGKTWLLRCNGNSSYGEFHDLLDTGDELVATTEKGLFYSRNKGRTWLRRH